eukprot:CAMPEP_0171988748 /NCGR_PEP_ID=MMETSP0993-20121228/276062_1 /TAXON_ID=483369 /ORGANISM="non described non described, Strain CCMP2098" /LENGTH=539 /DNA_ID=CAMNT_0012641725 /DNA_START=154 /DNA_END=1773 /DNA_ORIENTATION=-
MESACLAGGRGEKKNCGDGGGGNGGGGGGDAIYCGTASSRSLVGTGLRDNLEVMQYEVARRASSAPSSSLPTGPATTADADGAADAGAAASVAALFSDEDCVSSQLTEDQGWTPDLLKHLWKTSQPINVSGKKLYKEWGSMTKQESEASTMAAYRHLFRRWQATQVQDGNELIRWEALSALEKLETDDTNDLRTQRFVAKNGGGPTHKQPFIQRATSAVLPKVNVRDLETHRIMESACLVGGRGGKKNCGDGGGGNGGGGGGDAIYCGTASSRSLVGTGLRDNLEVMQYEVALRASSVPSSSLPTGTVTMADADGAANAGAAASVAASLSDGKYVSSQLTEGQGWTQSLLKNLWKTSQPINVSGKKLNKEWGSMTKQESEASTMAAYRHLFRRWQATQVQDGNELIRWEALSALEKLETDDTNDLRTQRFAATVCTNGGELTFLTCRQTPDKSADRFGLSRKGWELFLRKLARTMALGTLSACTIKAEFEKMHEAWPTQLLGVNMKRVLQHAAAYSATRSSDHCGESFSFEGSSSHKRD